ncbi:MAG: hypothetical protein BMS9Abin10_0921 [Gammaproteobacteria bacterium]|nr:MAG: hypothetical protein BMS9Abin10_0921 [Gammaproteobacteria bacterium]
MLAGPDAKRSDAAASLTKVIERQAPAGRACTSNAGMKKTNRSDTRTRKRGECALPATCNRRLTTQTRKILGKHYASKYRVRSR